MVGDQSVAFLCRVLYNKESIESYTNKASNLITFSEIFCNSNDLLGSNEYLVSSIVSCSEFLSQINCVSSYSQSWKGDFRERRD